jgi:TonB family protein
MYFVIRGKLFPLRRAVSFCLSASIHGGLLGWLALSTAANPEPRKSVYDQEIRPHEDHLVWYNLRGSLPDVSPSAAARDRRPPRARIKFNQTLVAGTKDNPHDRQMIWAPEPAVAAPKLPPLPNVLAVAPRPARPFVPPAARRIAAPVPLPEAPKAPALATAVPEYKPALPTPPHRRFTPPPQPKLAVKAAAPLPEAPAAPAIAMGVPGYKPVLPAPPQRGFTPPPAKRASVPAPDLPEAPNVPASLAVETPAYHAAVLPAPHREFTPPTAPKPAARADAPLPDAPPPPSVPETPASPALAIAGLDPAKLTDLPKPPGSREANFSAGPELRPKGGTDAASDGSSSVVVPGLLARGGAAAGAGGVPAPLPRPRAFDTLHPLDSVLPPPAGLDTAHATRVSGAPDPLLEGRVIYTMAIQMPNITSFSGSWMVWFAERATEGGKAGIEAPIPLRKVDPKYIATAVAERVEGKVRLSAIIRKDGRVDSVVLLRHLDPRLDETAEEALGKWIFQPARRNGAPIDVDAVFEIPFYLAPKPAR